MKKNVIYESMDMYTEITKVTTVCIDNFNDIHLLFSNGLDISSIIEYADFQEIIMFLDTVFKSESGISLEPYKFHTILTKNFFVYNIVFITTKKKTDIALVAGPILTFFPNKNSINEILINNGLPLYKKAELIGLLNNLPLATDERIYQLGKLLSLLSRTRTKNWNSPIQEFHGRKNSEKVFDLKYLKDSIDSEYDHNKMSALYKFCANIMDKIAHGNINGIIDIIGEYEYLFWDMESSDYNNRSLKNKCIIICSLACHFAIQANVPYERMFHYFWKSILDLEKANTVNDIIVQMEVTVEGFAHAVYDMSENGYSLHINRVIQYIKGHFTEKITLKQLSEDIKINPVYLSSLIKKETNMSLSDHINLIRIEESKKLLIYTNKPIYEIAYDVGYNYQNHYNTVFKKFVSLTPLEYRNQKGSKHNVPFK